MIGRLNHVALVVPSLEAAIETYQKQLGAQISAQQILPEHGVRLVFVTLPNTKIELLEPNDVNSPLSAFLEKNPSGGMHHICYEVTDIYAARDQLVANGARILGSPEPKIGAHGKPILFLHPKDFFGCLIELEQE